MSYNIHRAIGADGREDAARIAAVLREMNADVVALQEVGHRPGTRDDLLAKLARATGTQAHAGKTFEDERGHYGNAVLTRLPASAVHRHAIGVDGREPRGALELQLERGGRRIQLVATHLGLGARERRTQVRRLQPLCSSGEADVRILLGDFNEWWPWGRPLRWLDDSLGRSAHRATFPARLPLLALDRAWVAPRALLRDVHVHRSALARQASDHLPLVIDLAL
ncbi:endonuclease/exonuclease/phosphatase family protein [Mangrovimicrobium sediminis]|uniref:endonuclease/exonuclease/phosphatase family protein n=1 Tax=Mangrovimicrobium sediminis TaxID=2562682 RepID=UPI001980670B|nr:endonuclease/exonuclease/phosphatase family protein [Haliea sp. SAOS-164]